MKRIIVAFLLLTLIFVACKQSDVMQTDSYSSSDIQAETSLAGSECSSTDSSQTNSKTTSNISAIDSGSTPDTSKTISSYVSENSSSIINFSNYIRLDSTKSEEYNLAIKSFNDFLCRNIPASYTEFNGSISELYIDGLLSTGTTDSGFGISDFALYDVTGDGVPELHTRSLFYDIFWYNDGKLIHLFQSKTNFTNGSVEILENGALFSEHIAFGTYYNYTTFSGGVPVTTSFDYFEDEEEPSHNSYNFSNEKVSKEKWLNLTRDILILSETDVLLEWHDYK